MLKLASEIALCRKEVIHVFKKSRLLTRHNQGSTQWVTRPFPLERVGSGRETMLEAVYS